MGIVKTLSDSIKYISKKKNKNQFILWVSFFYNAAFYGFTPKQFIGLDIYEKSSKEKKQFINYYKANRINKKYNDNYDSNRLTDKALFNSLYKAYVKRDWALATEENSDLIHTMFKKHSELIAKPTSLSGGRGIYIIKTEEELKRAIETKDYIIEEIISNHDTIKNMSSCLNTVRIYTILEKGNIIKVIGCYLRVGGTDSITDNMHCGGHAVPIDYNTGIILSSGKSYKGQIFDNNPKTNKPYKGIKMPNWDNVQKCINDVCLITPKCRYCAWDIAITQEGIELIEGNIMPDPTLLQIYFGPAYHYFK